MKKPYVKDEASQARFAKICKYLKEEKKLMVREIWPLIASTDQNLRRILKGQANPKMKEVAKKLKKEYPEINKYWILDGSQDMLAPEVDPPHKSKNKEKILKEIVLLREHMERVYANYRKDLKEKDKKIAEYERLLKEEPSINKIIRLVKEYGMDESEILKALTAHLAYLKKTKNKET